MIPAAFDYVRARDVGDAVRLLRECGGDAKLLAGGQSLIPLMKLRFASPPLVVDIGGITGLGDIQREADGITVGALATHAAIAADDRLRRHAPALHDAATELGDAQVRHRGTVAGSCAHNDPAADYPAVMLALEARFRVTGPGGSRVIRATDLFLPMYETTLAPDDVITHVSFVDAPGSAYVKFPHPASGFAVVGAAVALCVTDGVIAEARVALTGAGYAATRLPGVDRALVGVGESETEGVRAACRGVAADVELRSDAFASAAYRAALADVVVQRAVARALRRADG